MLVPNYPTLKPGWGIISENKEIVCVFPWGEDSFKFTDTMDFKAVLPYLDGRHSIQEIMCSSASPAELFKLLLLLTSKGVLEASLLAEVARSIPGFNLQSLANARIHIAGNGIIKDRLQELLQWLQLKTAAFPDAELVLATLPPLAAAAMNRKCWKAGKAWINAALEDNAAVVGPSVLPPHPPCYQCYRMRYRENLYHLFEAKILRLPGKATQSDAAGLMAKALARELLVEGIKILARKPDLKGKVMNLAPDLRQRLITLVPKSTCPQCGKKRTLVISPAKLKLPGAAPEFKDYPTKYVNNGFRILPVEQTLEKVAPLQQGLGVITGLYPLYNHAIAPVYLSISADPMGTNIDRFHYGKGVGLLQTQASAALEAIERYCGKQQGDEVLVKAGYREVKAYALNPESLPLPRNYPTPYTPETKIAWHWGHNLTSGKAVLVPADLVYCPYRPLPGIEQVLPTVSTGLAAGNCLEEAVLHAILEVLERDAHAIMEYTFMPTPDVDLTSCRNKDILALVAGCRSEGLEVHIKLVTNDIKVPVFGVYLEKPGSAGKVFGVGFGASLSPDIALLRALTEAIQIYPIPLREWLAENPEYRTDHRKNSGAARVAYKDIPQVSTGSIKPDIEKCLSLVSAAGLEVIMVDLSRAELGFAVVRIIIPGIQGIFNADGIWVTPRMLGMPKKLGYARQEYPVANIYHGSLAGCRLLPHRFNWKKFPPPESGQVPVTPDFFSPNKLFAPSPR